MRVAAIALALLLTHAAFAQETGGESPGTALTAPPPGVSLTGYWRLDPRLIYKQLPVPTGDPTIGDHVVVIEVVDQDPDAERYDQAKSAFRQARGSDSERAAAQWISYIDQELQRLDELQRSLEP